MRHMTNNLLFLKKWKATRLFLFTVFISSINCFLRTKIPQQQRGQKKKKKFFFCCANPQQWRHLFLSKKVFLLFFNWLPLVHKSAFFYCQKFSLKKIFFGGGGSVKMTYFFTFVLSSLAPKKKRNWFSRKKQLDDLTKKNCVSAFCFLILFLYEIFFAKDEHFCFFQKKKKESKCFVQCCISLRTGTKPISHSKESFS